MNEVPLYGPYQCVSLFHNFVIKSDIVGMHTTHFESRFERIRNNDVSQGYILARFVLRCFGNPSIVASISI